MYDSIDLARHIMSVCTEKGHEYSNTKINKLVYLVYGFYLALYEKEIITERPKYFPYGPVFPRVFKKYDDLKPLKISVKTELEDVIDTVLKHFGDKSAGYLSAWSHAKGSPWDRIYQEKGENWGEEMQVFDIMNYFKQMVKFKDE